MLAADKFGAAARRSGAAVVKRVSAVRWLRRKFRDVLVQRRIGKPSAKRRVRIWASKPMKIVAMALGIGVIAGLVELGLPAEDVYRAVRAEIRSHEAPSDIVVVTIDDATLNELQTDIPDRKQDAQLIDRLFAAGATRVFFDKAYADPTNQASDMALAEALARHDEVYLGAAPASEVGIERYATMMPARIFRERARLASMVGEAGPFGLSYRFPTLELVDGKKIPSISAGLAGYRGDRRLYRPDFGINIHTIKNVSYIDVLRGRFASNTFDGAAVVIGQTFSGTSDTHYEPLGAKIPGVYFHALGAHTLREGVPVDLGWLPALLFSAAALLWQAQRMKPDRKVSAAALVLLISVPLGLDYLSIGVDIFPAILCLAIGTVRLERHSQKMFDETTGCLRVEALERLEPSENLSVFALKIREFSFITRNSSDGVIIKFIEETIKRLSATEAGTQFAFHKDTIIWLRPKLQSQELIEHLEGLHALFRTGVGHAGGTVDIAAHLGVDENWDASMRSRIATAIQSAEDALHAGTHAIVANAEYLEQRDKRLSLLSDLDEAMARNNVQVAYQPKVDLKTGRTIGAEALLRWTHPLHGAIPPEDVIAMAEAHKRIDDLTIYVIDTALAGARLARQLNPDFHIAINMSAVALTRGQLIYDMTYLMSKHRVPAEKIILEVTETAPLDDRRVAAVMAGLREFGIQLSIDDFGTGQGALSYVKRIPGSEVKIDRTFVGDMLTSAESRSVVQATIDIAHSLERRAVAEGVEDAETAKVLRDMGCDHAQGYFFAPAMPINEILTHLRGARTAA